MPANMHRVVLVIATLFLTTLAFNHRESLPVASDDVSLELLDRYIISLKPEVDAATHVETISRSHGGHDTYRGILHVYDIPGFDGYAAHFNSSFVQDLQAHADVASIESDQLWKACRVVEAHSPNYGLGLISHRPLRFPHTYVYDDSAGSGTFAYVLDSGIQTKHVEFQGRASFGVSVTPLKTKSQDPTGHGTHIAGIIGSKTYGVVKKCKLIAVQVSNDGTSFTSVVLKGFEWAVKDIVNRRRAASSVINLSMASGRSDAFEASVNGAFRQGIITVVAAGNENRDTGSSTPNRAGGAIVVAATNLLRYRARFSNYGPRISLFGPGVDILSTWIGPTNGAVAKRSGTSQAAAHIAGLVLYLRSLYPRLADAYSTKRFLLSEATTSSVTDVKTSPNKFGYNNSGQ